MVERQSDPRHVVFVAGESSDRRLGFDVEDDCVVVLSAGNEETAVRGKGDRANPAAVALKPGRNRPIPYLPLNDLLKRSTRIVRRRENILHHLRSKFQLISLHDQLQPSLRKSNSPKSEFFHYQFHTRASFQFCSLQSHSPPIHILYLGRLQTTRRS